jgi:hypothetical protein
MEDNTTISRIFLKNRVRKKQNKSKIWDNYELEFEIFLHSILIHFGLYLQYRDVCEVTPLFRIFLRWPHVITG